MSEYTIQDFIDEAEKQDQFYKEQISKFDNLLDDYKKKIDELQNQKNFILNNITRKFIPEFTEAVLDKFSQTFSPARNMKLFSIYSEEKKQISNKITEIEKFEDYQKREALSDPESGVITTQMNELKPLYNTAMANYEKINGFKGFQGLKLRKYGTSSYQYQGFTKYLIPLFYKDWKNSDEIVAAMGVKNFIDVLTEYDQAEQQVKSFGGVLKDYRDQLDRIKKLTKDHDELLDKLNSLDDVYYLKLGNIILEYFKSTDRTAIQNFFAVNRNMEEDFKKLDGLDHQIDYIKQLYEKVVNERSKLVTKAGKIKEEAQRYKMNQHKYRNKKFSEDQFGSKFTRDGSKYDGMYDRYYGYGDTVYGFNNYSGSSLIADFLWWDLITDGRIDGNFIPEVNEFHNSHPDYAYESPSTDSSTDSSTDQS